MILLRQDVFQVNVSSEIGLKLSKLIYAIQYYHLPTLHAALWAFLFLVGEINYEKHLIRNFLGAESPAGPSMVQEE